MPEFTTRADRSARRPKPDGVGAGGSPHARSLLVNAILAAGEPLVKLAVLAREIGKHPCSLSRWVATGVRLPDGSRVKLEAVKVGRELRTSREAWRRFLAATSAPLGDPANFAPASPTERRNAAEAACRELAAAGA